MKEIEKIGTEPTFNEFMESLGEKGESHKAGSNIRVILNSAVGIPEELIDKPWR